MTKPAFLVFHIGRWVPYHWHHLGSPTSSLHRSKTFLKGLPAPLLSSLPSLLNQKIPLKSEISSLLCSKPCNILHIIQSQTSNPYNGHWSPVGSALSHLHLSDFFCPLHPIILVPVTPASSLFLNTTQQLWNSVQSSFLPRKPFSHLCLANSLTCISSLLKCHPVCGVPSPHLPLHSPSPFPSSTFHFLLALAAFNNCIIYLGTIVTISLPLRECSSTGV